MTQIAHALHEMCQPLTVLQCRLEIDLMEAEPVPVEVKQTAAACLRECERLNDRVQAIRGLVRRAMEQRQERERVEMVAPLGVNQG